MSYKFRPRHVSDYDHVPRGLGSTERELKALMCQMGADIFRERLGPDHALTVEFQGKAAAWLASLGAGADTSCSGIGRP